MTRAFQAQARARRFCKEEGGVTAVEFSLVAIPFFLLVFGIFEFGRALHMQATLDDIADRTIRQIYIAKLDPAMDEANLEAQMTIYARSVLTTGDATRLAVDVSPGPSPAYRTMTVTYLFQFSVDLTGTPDMLLRSARAFKGA